VRSDQKAAFLETLSKNGVCALTVEGRSMWPFIRAGDCVTIVTAGKMPRAGSVVAVFNNDQCIVHRVVKICGRPGARGDVWICGDSSPGSQTQIQSSDIIGVAESIERNGKRHTRWLRPPLSLLALFFGIVLRAMVTLRIH
jgi:hypothetical protein